MRISAMIADWDWMRREYGQQAEQRSQEEEDRLSMLDSFTQLNGSFHFNISVGEMFVAARGSLPVEVAGSIEEFLVTFCPALAEQSRFAPPRDPEVRDVEVHYATLSPEEVRRRLGLLDGGHLFYFLMELYEYLKGHRDDPSAVHADMVMFVLMWAAALGQAASKGWGLAVTVG